MEFRMICLKDVGQFNQIAQEQILQFVICYGLDIWLIKNVIVNCLDRVILGMGERM